MDIFVILGAIALAYAGMLVIYYNLHKKEKKKRLSDLMFLGTTSMRRGNLEKALIYFHKAYEYSIEVDDKEHMGDSLYNIGLILKKQGRMNEALEFMEEALNIYKEIEDEEKSKKIMKVTQSLRKPR